MEKCKICNESFSDGNTSVVLRAKGSNGVNHASAQRGSSIVTIPGDRVHIECRRSYCKAENIARDNVIPSLQQQQIKHNLRSEHNFNFQEHCLFCGQPTEIDKKHKQREKIDIYPVRTGDFQEMIVQVCHLRNDEWSDTVLGRMSSVHDLHAADAVYHNICNTNFRNMKNIPSQFSANPGNKPKRLKLGRPEDYERTTAVLKVANFLEEYDDEQITIQDLIVKMTEYLQDTGCEPYCAKWMKIKIKEHFGDRVIMTGLENQCVVTLRDTAHSILREFHKQQKSMNPEDEKLNIIKTAAKLIGSDVKFMEVLNDSYPASSDIAAAASYVPESLRVLLRNMFAGKNIDTKVASIGQSIMQAIRPRTMIAPLQLGLGVQMHHHFASRFLVNTLHEHGFACSYADVIKYEQSAAVAQGTEIPGFTEEHHIQYVADNVDHNVATIDGTGTFHGMGIIACITPGTQQNKPVPKIQVTAADIAAVGRINIQYFMIPPIRAPIVYQPLALLPADNKTSQLDVLWKTSLLLHSQRPSWSGMMQILHLDEHPGRASVTFLPMIDLDPSDESCIYSTLRFVATHALQYDVTPVLTFDQPLFWKALNIIQSQPSNNELKRIVLRLGGFHMKMSFLGSIGHLMAGSGLEELLEVVYAGNTVCHMMSGKAVSRAVRGHMLVDAALNAMLLADAYNVPLPTKDTVEHPPVEMTPAADTEPDEEVPDTQETVTTDLSIASELYDQAMSSNMPMEGLCSADVLVRIQSALNNKKESMHMRTAQLWLQYMDMIDILRNFIKAERTGNWRLHLQCVQDMLPYFATSGHRLYAKSAYVYLQMMTALPETHPDVHKKFEEGFHVVRRSNRYWAGLSTDLIIEQVLMRSVKTHGGLTRGKGFTETQRLVWVLSDKRCQ